MFLVFGVENIKQGAYDSTIIVGDNTVWTYSNKNGTYDNSINSIVFNITNDLYYEAKYSSKNPNLRHSIAKTIKVTEFKLS